LTLTLYTLHTLYLAGRLNTILTLYYTHIIAYTLDIYYYYLDRLDYMDVLQTLLALHNIAAIILSHKAINNIEDIT